MKGLPGLQARIDAIGRNTPNVVAIALTEEAHIIMADSVTHYVPRDTGTLANSGRVEAAVVSGNEVSVTMGFGGNAADYALSVHENPRSGKTGGQSPSGARYPSWARTGQWKYLETPLKAHAPEVAATLRASIDAYVESLGQGDTVNVRVLPKRVPRPTGNDIIEGP